MPAVFFGEKRIHIWSNGFPVYTNGRVIPNGGLNVNGKPTDAIMYNIEFSDDPGSLYFVHGVRYAGF